ncbi:hypothetical protein F7725_015142 [Dissostichus mawsoni]|uniref:Uncharacterized protein n=1 Tax=Dissostichus mawsoni TaxID=36200 RepID=A0A7J5YGS4_DISMA|nr:hypothetical protein F7725_015142 [Dissostichus mawsoni]
MLRTDSKAGKKDKEVEKEKKEDVKRSDTPKLCRRSSSLRHRARTPPVAVMKGEKPCSSSSSSSSPAKACFKSSCLSSAQAQLGVLHKMLCSGPNARPGTPNRALPQNCSGGRAGPLTSTQAETLRQVQEILGGLVSGARCKLDPAKVAEKLLDPVQSLEGVLETSQNTIKVLDVIQDLEKKEAERDGSHSFGLVPAVGARWFHHHRAMSLKREGERKIKSGMWNREALPNIAAATGEPYRQLSSMVARNEKALEIWHFTVKWLREWELRKKKPDGCELRSITRGHFTVKWLREWELLYSSHSITSGHFTVKWLREWELRESQMDVNEGQVVRTWKVGDPPEGSPQTPTPQHSTPQQLDSPQAERPPATTKKNRKKCFWFL